MDFDGLFEGLAQSTLKLLADVLRNGRDFLIDPSLFANATVRSSSTKLGPLTFLVISLMTFVAELLVIERMAKRTNIQVHISPSPDEWSKALTKLDAKALLKAAMPFVALISLHALCVKTALATLGSDIPLRSVFFAGCQIGGTVFLLFASVGMLYIVALPRLLPTLRSERANRTPPGKVRFLTLVVAVPPWVLMLKGVHSYFVLLSALSRTPTWMTIGAWFVGTLGLALVAIAFVAWFSPALFPEPDEEASAPGKAH